MAFRPLLAIVFALVLVLIDPCLGTNFPVQVKLPKSSKPGGVCMDGTPAGYYYHPPTSKSSSKWVVWLQGGGSCNTKDVCTKRSKGYHGSSKGWKATMTNSRSLLSDNATLNPDFYDSHMVFVPYCSSDVHVGQRETADASTFGFFFSGHLNFVQIIDHLNQTQPAFNQATHIVLTGSSAGGAGTFGNLDWMRSVIPDHIVLKGAPHAGFFFPGYTADQHKVDSDVYLPPSAWANWSVGGTGGLDMGLSNVLWDGLPNKDCVDHWASQGKQILCSSICGSYPFIKTPLFAFENMFDTNQLHAQLGVPKNNSDPQVRNYIGYFGHSMGKTITAQHFKKGDGFFLPSCFDHGGGLGPGGSTTIQGAPTQAELFGDWFFERGKISNYFVADNCEMAPPGLPCNPTCLGVDPPPSECSKQLEADGCAKYAHTDPNKCGTCAQQHTADLTKAGCTRKLVRQLCGLL